MGAALARHSRVAEAHAPQVTQRRSQARRKHLPRSTPLMGAGVLKKSVHLDLPLQHSDEVLQILRLLCRELPKICSGVERENDEQRRLLMAQAQLRSVAEKISTIRLKMLIQ